MIRRMGMILGLGGMAAALAIGWAAANEPSLPAGERTFSRVDKDKDGKIGASELAPRAQKRFMSLDVDKDGAVTAEEIDRWLKASMDRRRDRMMTRLDADKDGRISGAEVEAEIGEMLNAADADKDGGVTLAEAKSYYADRRKEFFQRLRASRNGD